MVRPGRQLSKSASSAFSWDKYLKQTNSKAAPANYFKQSLVALSNTFEVGMKLEAVDPRNSTSTCIASVVEVMGPRICLRLDGSDTLNDFWRPVDSADIQSMGTCESKEGEILQPPLGYRGHCRAWPKFLIKTLTDAVIAPKECFLNQPKTPSANLFEVGMKLEAEDRKNSHLVCAASVVDVKEDKIQISFDGYGSAFNYWTNFDSREIFPVGWCHLNEHPLQQPGNIGEILSLASPSIAPTRNNSKKIRKKSNTLGEVTSETNSKRDLSVLYNRSVTQPVTESESETETQNPSEKLKSETFELEKSLNINASCCWGTLNASKFKSYLPELNGILELEELYERIISIFNKSMDANPKSVNIDFKKKRFRNFQQFKKEITEIVRLTGACKNLICFEEVQCSNCSVPDNPMKTGADWVTNRALTIKSTPRSTRASRAPKIPMYSVCKNKNLRAPLEKKIFPNGQSPDTGISSTLKGTAHRKRKASQPTQSDSASPITSKIGVPETTTTLAVLGTQNGTASQSQSSQIHSQFEHFTCPPLLPIRVVGTNDFCSSTVLNPNPNESGLLSPKDWTVEEVIQYIVNNNVDMTRYANAFREHEIDGKAMLLLNSDMMCSTMGLTLGSALKIYDLFLEFRS